MIATMTEEYGEVARVTNHLYGDKKKKDKETFRTLESIHMNLSGLVCLCLT